jgi:hypothetical protein
MNTIPQYRQAYPAHRASVSQSLPDIVSQEFGSNQNIIWHKLTHSQRRYYFVKNETGDDEVRVRISGGIFGKAGK